MANREMKAFAPMPLSALNGKQLKPREFRLLGHLLGLRTFFGMKDAFQVTDDDLLHGLKRGKNRVFPSCGLTRNTMKPARDGLASKNYIRLDDGFEDERGCWVHRYELVEGMAIRYKDSKDDDIPFLHSPLPAESETQQPDPNCQEMTEQASKSDTHKRKTDSIDKNETPHSDEHVVNDDAQEHVPNQAFEEASWDPEYAAARRHRPRRRVELSPERQAAHARLMGEIARLYKTIHPDHLDLPSPQRTGMALKHFMLANPSYDEAVLLRAVENRLLSDIHPTQSPHIWIPDLGSYTHAPLDKYRQAAPERRRELVRLAPSGNALREARCR